MKPLDSYPEEVRQRIEYFLENSNLGRMSKTIRTLFFAYLRDSKEGFRTDFDEVLYDVEELCVFLEFLCQKSK